MINFNNLKTAFSDKSDTDLNRAYLLFKTISSPFISKTLTAFVKVAMWLRLPINPIIRATVYKHFCGGTTIENSQETIDKLWESNIGTILDFSAEGKESEVDFNRAMKETISSIKKAKEESSIPFSVFKPTGLTKFSLLEKLSEKKDLNENEKIENLNFRSRYHSLCRWRRNYERYCKGAREHWRGRF